MSPRVRGAAVAVAAVALPALTACSGQQGPPPTPAVLSAHAAADTLLPVTEGTGARQVREIRLTRSAPLGVEIRCAGSGRATVTLRPTPIILGVSCTTKNHGGSITGSDVFPDVAGAAGPATVSVQAAHGTRWNVTVYHSAP